MTKHIQRTWRRGGITLALGLALGVLSGCDLNVDLPSQLTEEALNDPAGAGVLINSIIHHFEQPYDTYVYHALGREEGGEVYLCGPCASTNYVTSAPHFEAMSESLWFNEQLRTKLVDEWTQTQVPDRNEFLAITSIYEGAVLSVFGQSMCEVALAGGELLGPDAVLNQADAALTRALAEIQTAGDFELPNGISESARAMAYGLRAQVRWFKGDEAGAAADAQQVPQEFMAYATREPGERQNFGWFSGTFGGFFELYDPIDWWSGLPNPATGQEWPSPIPFTGWTYLGIMPDGRAVHDNGIPVRTQAGWHNAHGVEAGAVRDLRVPHETASVTGKSTTFGEVAIKHTGEGSDHPLVNWKEMVLIRAEIAGGQAAIDLVNELRDFDDLPRVTYLTGATATPQQIDYMVWEERRRTLFNEARFYATKLKNIEVFWFPRANGGTRGQVRNLQGGVRYAMPNDEYIANENLSLADKATGCAQNERPVDA